MARTASDMQSGPTDPRKLTKSCPGCTSIGCHVIAFALVMCNMPFAFCLPAAQMVSDPSGPWNSNGGNLLNSSCVPLTEEFTAQLLLGAIALDSPIAYRGLLTAINGVGNPYGAWETPIAIRTGAYIHSALWDAAVAYSDKAIPIVKNGITRRPPEERNVTNTNIAMSYAVLRVVEEIIPDAKEGVLLAFQAFNLDPEDKSIDPSSPIGVGNLVGRAVIKEQAKDEYNSDGRYGNIHNQRAFSDYTNFIPLNDAYELKNITKWQPLMETNGKGYFTIQTHITPQAQNAAFKLGASALQSDPGASIGRLEEPWVEPVDMDEYRRLTDEVLEVSANLTDEQKMLAEYFDNKFMSFGVLEWYMVSEEESLLDLLGVALNIVCLGNAINLSWQQKLFYNSVRPVSAVRHLYGGQNITAWGGQYQGTQEIDGNDWLPYMRTMPHADYPSGTACICAAFAEYIRRFNSDPDEFPEIPPLVFRQGCSRREPFMTPAEDVVVEGWDSWDDFVSMCGETRLWAGVHFRPAIDSAIEMCKPLGQQCYEDYEKLKNGIEIA